MKKLLLVAIIVSLLGCIRHIDYTPLMSGDCVDRAVIIRQDLRQQGYDAQLVLGLRGNQGHCWVKYREKNTKEWKEIKNY